MTQEEFDILIQEWLTEPPSWSTMSAPATTTHPADGSSDWKDLSQVKEVDGASKMRYNYQDQDYVQLTLNGTTDHNGRNIRLIAYNGYWVWLRQTDIPQ